MRHFIWAGVASLMALGACVEDGEGEGEPDQAVGAPMDASADVALQQPDAAAPEPDAAAREPDAAAPEPDAAAPEPDAAAPVDPSLGVGGTYLLAIAVDVDPTKPLLFLAAVVVHPEEDGPTIEIVLQPLTADEARAPVGQPLVTQPAPLDQEGRFELDFGRVQVDGAADPILPGQPITMDLTLRGIAGGEVAICGTLAGQVLQPAALPLSGSFGVTPATAAEVVDAPEVVGCEGDD